MVVIVTLRGALEKFLVGDSIYDSKVVLTEPRILRQIAKTSALVPDVSSQWNPRM